ncbi:DUF481 domain-containing protein [Acidobacteriota bacterium]
MRKSASFVLVQKSPYLFLILFFLLGTSWLHAQRTDVVILKNGDKITGEIKKLDRGILQFKTDNMDTLHIQWDFVDSLGSNKQFDVESVSGLHYIGPIKRADKEGQMVVATEEMEFTLSIKNVIRMSPLEATFWRRMKGYLDAGFSYQKADKFAEFTLGGEISIRSPKWSNKLLADFYIRRAKEGRDIFRNSATYNLERLFQNRWTGSLFGTLEQNDELNLDFRALFGLSVGRYVVQNNHMLMLLSGGLAASREKLITDENFSTRLEALIGTNFEAFRFQTPKLDFSASLIVFPSLSEFGRIRINFDTRLRYEIFKDFYVGLKVLDHFDGDLRKEGITSNDFGVNLTISYSFK